MNVHHSNSKDVPYYPMRYFRRQVVAWMIKHHQLVMANKGVALMANYGLEEENDQFKGPLSYKQYLWHVLQCCFWGDEIILYAINCMWNLWITVLNSRTLEEYRIWHSFSLTDADVGIVDRYHVPEFLTQVQPLIYFQDSISWHPPKSYKEHLATAHVLCSAVNHAQC